MLDRFISQAYFQSNNWACERVSRISALIDKKAPDLTQIEIDSEQTQAVINANNNHQIVTIGDSLRAPWNRDENLDCFVLLLQQKPQSLIMPTADLQIYNGDQ